MSEPKYPEIEVELVGGDGNAFMVLGRVVGAMKKARVSPGEIARYMDDARSGDYDHLLRVTQQWVTVL